MSRVFCTFRDFSMRLNLNTGTLQYTNPQTGETTTVSRLVPTLNSKWKPDRPLGDWDWKYDPPVSEDTMWKARQLWTAEFNILAQSQSSVTKLTNIIYKTQKPDQFASLEDESADAELQWFN